MIWPSRSSVPTAITSQRMRACLQAEHIRSNALGPGKGSKQECVHAVKRAASPCPLANTSSQKAIHVPKKAKHADDDQINGHHVVQQPGDKKDQNSRDQCDDRLQEHKVQRKLLVIHRLLLSVWMRVSPPLHPHVIT